MLSLGQILGGSLTKPFYCLGFVFRYTDAVDVAAPETGLSTGPFTAIVLYSSNFRAIGCICSTFLRGTKPTKQAEREEQSNEKCLHEKAISAFPNFYEEKVGFRTRVTADFCTGSLGVAG